MTTQSPSRRPAPGRGLPPAARPVRSAGRDLLGALALPLVLLASAVSPRQVHELIEAESID